VCASLLNKEESRSGLGATEEADPTSKVITSSIIRVKSLLNKSVNPPSLKKEERAGPSVRRAALVGRFGPTRCPKERDERTLGKMKRESEPPITRDSQLLNSLRLCSKEGDKSCEKLYSGREDN